jgi:hypothetical protein
MGASRLLVVCRAAVSLLGEAQWPSHRAPSVGTQLTLCVLIFKSSHRCLENALLTCPFRISSFMMGAASNYQSGVRAICASNFKSSLRPHGRLKFCSLFAGRRCLRLFRHGHDNVFLNLREYSYLCARSFSKVPIVLMGKLLTCLPRLSLAQLRLTLRSTTGCTSRRDLNFSHRPHGRLTFCSLFAGRRCLRLFRHGHDNVFLDHR